MVTIGGIPFSDRSPDGLAGSEVVSPQVEETYRPTEPPPTRLPLRGQFLNSDGSIREDSQGGMRVAGYRMVLTESGAPRFIQAGACQGWDDRFGLVGGPNSEVFAVAVMGRSLFIGGSFISVGGVSANRIARYDLDTGVWTALGRTGGNGVNESVTSLAVVGSVLYVGGFFTEANIGGTQVRASRIARYDTLTGVWSGVGVSGGNGVNDLVFDMVVSGTDLYVGGTFTSANEGSTRVPVNSLARLNTITGAWSPVGFAGGNGVDGVVLALMVLGSDLYIGGRFLAANTGGQLFFASNVVMFRPGTSSWATLGSSNGNGVDNEVKAFTVLNGILYVGGNFRTAGSGSMAVTVNHVAAYNPATNSWSGLGNGLGNGLNGGVNSLTTVGSDLIVAGDFTLANIGGTTVAANRLVRFSTTASTWISVGGGPDGKRIVGPVYRLLNVGGDVYLGGNFAVVDANGTTIYANNLVSYGTSNGLWGRVVNSTGEGANSDVYAMVRVGNRIYFGGRFNSIGGISANYIAAYDLTTGNWSKLGAGAGNGVNEVVLDMTVVGTDLYVAGAFTAANIGGTQVPVGYAAKYDTLTGLWSSLGAGGGNGLNDTAYTVTAIGSEVFFGGSFTSASIGGGQIRVNRLAKYDSNAQKWSAVGSGTGNGVNEFIFTLAVLGTDLYVGGIFSFVNEGGSGLAANSIARFSTATNTWSTLGSGGGNGVDEVVSAIEVIGTDLYVGGIFSSANIGGTRVVVKNIARYDTLTSTWSALGSNGGNGVEDDGVSSMAVVGKDLYVGGYFTSVNTSGPAVSANRVARYIPATKMWSALTDQNGGNGVDYNVYSMLGVDRSLYVGGGFSVAGDGRISSNIARYCPNSPPVISPIAQVVRQGSRLATVPIATVSDEDQTVDTLKIAAKLDAGSGVGLTDVRLNPQGIVTASLDVSCSAVSSSFTISVNDAFGATTSIVLNVNVVSNAPPTLVYGGTASVVTGGSLVIRPTGAVSDNGAISSVVVQSRGNFTGAVAVDSAGEVTVTNAAPSGVHNLTIRATDNCGASTDATIRLVVNTLPTVTTAGVVVRQAGSAGSSSVIATVRDAETPAGNLLVTVAGLDQSGGVEISGLVNNNGTVTANITAACTAPSGTIAFTIQVSDGIETATAPVSISVSSNTQPVLSYSGGQVGAGGATLINPQTGPRDNGSISGVIVERVSSFTGTITVDQQGVVRVGQAGPVGVHQITIRVTDNCGLATEAVFALTVTPTAINLTSASPEQLIAGGGAFELTVNGSGFTAGMLVKVNGENRPTRVISSTRLVATILTVDIATPGVLNITVADLFGSLSPPLSITIYDRVTVTTATSYTIGEVAPDSISVAFAAAKMASAVRVVDSFPIPTSLLGTRVSVRDSSGIARDQQLFFIAPQQINFLLHRQTAFGRATVTIYLEDKIVALGSIEVVRVTPGLFTQNSTGEGVPAAYALLISGGNATGVPISAYNQSQSAWLPIPIDLGSPDDKVFLVLFGSGLRGGTGVSGITATLGEKPVPIGYVGADTVFLGLDQLNIGPLPRSLAGVGLVELVVSVDGKRANTGKSVRVQIK